MGSGSPPFLVGKGGSGGYARQKVGDSWPRRDPPTGLLNHFFLFLDFALEQRDVQVEIRRRPRFGYLPPCWIDHRVQDGLARKRQRGDPRTAGIVNRVGHCSKGRNNRHLTDTAHAVGSVNRRHLDENALDVRRVKGCRHPVVQQARVHHPALRIHPVLFVQSPADALHAAQADGQIFGAEVDVDLAAVVAFLGIVLVVAQVIAFGWRPAATANLVFNGDFSEGNNGFTTSYIYSPDDIGLLQCYSILRNPQSGTLNPVDKGNFGDHSTGKGLMMVVNGSADHNVVVWGQDVPVQPGHAYEFEAWVASWHQANPAVVEAYLGGTLDVSAFKRPVGERA